MKEENEMSALFADLYYEGGRPTPLLWAHLRRGLLSDAERARLAEMLEADPSILEDDEEDLEIIEIPESWHLRAEAIEREVFGPPVEVPAEAPVWFVDAFPPLELAGTTRRDRAIDATELETLRPDWARVRAALVSELASWDDASAYRGDAGRHVGTRFAELASAIERLRKSLDLPKGAMAELGPILMGFAALCNAVLSRADLPAEVQIPSDRTAYQTAMEDHVEAIVEHFGVDSRPFRRDIQREIRDPWMKLTNALFQAIDRGGAR